MSEADDLRPLVELVSDAVARVMGVDRVPPELEPVIRRAIFEAHRRGRRARRRSTQPFAPPQQGDED